jgi:hypothetical protein
MEQMEFLGHTINKDSIRPNKDKIRVIIDNPAPKTKSNVKSFRGSYYRRFIRNFASRTYHMRFLTMEKTKMVWTKECQMKFEDIKQELISDNIITIDESKADIVDPDETPLQRFWRLQNANP